MAFDEKKPLVCIGALWKNKSGRGLSGRLGDARLVVLENTRKDKENQPDYRVFVATPDRKTEGGGNTGVGGGDDDAPF